MAYAGIETTLELWALSLRAVKARMRPLFTQERVAASAGRFLEVLLSDERRKTGWMRAEAAGDPGPWRQQAILGRGHWDAEALRDFVREYVLEPLADPDAVLVVDETGFLKQGKASVGVARQYTGSAGKITNCQIGVFAAYVSRHSHAFIDRALYLPQAWAKDAKRRTGAHGPSAMGFAPKPTLARRMIARAIAAEVPFAWVAADTVYGVGEIEMALRRAGKGYVLGVASDQMFNARGRTPPISGTAAEIAATLKASAWQRLSAGEGTKGPRLHDWAYLALADLEANEYGEDRSGLWTRGLLIRRDLADGEMAFFTTWCPTGTSIETLVGVEGHRWAVEIAFTQLTKADVLALGGDGQHIADFDVSVGDDHAIDEQHHELTAPLEVSFGQPPLHPRAEGLQRGRYAGELLLARRVVTQQRLLPGQGLHAPLQIAAPPFILIERDDRSKVGVGEPLDLLAQMRLATAQRFAAREQLLGQPRSAMGTGDRRCEWGWLVQQRAQILPYQLIELFGGDITRRAARRPMRARALSLAIA